MQQIYKFASVCQHKRAFKRICSKIQLRETFRHGLTTRQPRKRSCFMVGHNEHHGQETSFLRLIQFQIKLQIKLHLLCFLRGLCPAEPDPISQPWGFRAILYLGLVIRKCFGGYLPEVLSKKVNLFCSALRGCSLKRV